MNIEDNEYNKIYINLSEKDDLCDILNQSVKTIRDKVLLFISKKLKEIGFEVKTTNENNIRYNLICKKNDIEIKIEYYIFSNGNSNLIYKINKNHKSEHGRFCSIDNFIKNIDRL